MCWFPDRQVVSLCSGGPDKSKRMSELSLGGENPHTLISLLFSMQCGRKKHRDADKLLGGELTRVFLIFLKIRKQLFILSGKTLGWLSILGSHLRGTTTLIEETQLIKHSV